MAYHRSSGPDPGGVSSGNPAVPTISGPEGNYRVIRLLGRGTMGSVYLAEQVSMARPVALKILPPSLSSDHAFVERFLREARAAARLNHPHIVAALDFGEFESCYFLAMEYVDGASLSALLVRDGPVDEPRAVAMGLQVISALEHASSHNVVHLDVKPANIMVQKDGNVKLTDFGLAVILDTPGAAELSRRAMGTPYYMAPEQVEGGKVDWRTDQFSLGASLYEAVTGEKPFRGDSVSDILLKRFFEKPVPAWKVGGRMAGRAFSSVLAKMLSRSPEGRYQSFTELKDDFQRVQTGRKPMASRLTSAVSRARPDTILREGFGYASSVSRVDEMLWKKRWSLILYFCLFFIVVLTLYLLSRSRPMPPRLIQKEMLAQAEQPPEDVAKTLREEWKAAFRLFLRAEQEPDSPMARGAAVGGLRGIVFNPKYVGTAYAAEARRMMRALEEGREERLEEGR